VDMKSSKPMTMEVSGGSRGAFSSGSVVLRQVVDRNAAARITIARRLVENSCVTRNSGGRLTLSIGSSRADSIIKTANAGWNVMHDTGGRMWDRVGFLAVWELHSDRFGDLRLAFHHETARVDQASPGEP